jgi:uncharacterized protein
VLDLKIVPPYNVVVSVLLFLILGAIFGFSGGLFGIGGGIIAIPILGILFGMNEQLAQGTALVMIIPNAVTGVWNYLRAVTVDWRMIALMTVIAIPVTTLAAHVITLLPSRPVRLGFSFFLAALSPYVAWRALRPPLVAQLPFPWQSSAILGAISGALSGAFTVGGAILAIPVLTSFYGLSQVAAQATALAFALPGTFFSLAVYGMASDTDWQMGVLLAIGGVAAVPYGVKFARRLPDRMLRLFFSGFLIVCAVALYVRAVKP